MMHLWIRFAVAVGLIYLAGGNMSLSAAVPPITVVSPPNYANAVAGYMDDAPLGAAEQHFQQIIAPSLIPGIQVGATITGLGFRVVTGDPSVPAQVVPNYQIWLSQSALNPASMSLTFSQNRGADFTLVRTGSLNITENMFPGGIGLNAMGIIQFTTPYVYQGGSLLIEVAYDSFPLGGVRADAAYPFDTSVARTGFGDGYSATVADGLFGEALVMGFQVVPVPEPSFVLPLAGGLLLLAFYARNRR